MAGNKIPTTLHLTERQNTAISQEAKRLEIKFADLVRRILDEWLAKQPPKPGHGRII